MKKVKFTKMQGDGSTFIVNNKPTAAIKLSNRNFGIESDGLVFIYPSEIADFRIQMFNLSTYVTPTNPIGTILKHISLYN